jgi:hypothetical protein
MDRACSTRGKNRNAYRILVVTPEENMTLGRQTWVGGHESDRHRMRWYVLDSLGSG